jgi:transposase
LLEQPREHLACQHGQTVLRILEDAGQLAPQPRHPLGHHEPELAQKSPDLVHLSGPVGHRERSGPVHHQHRLLLLALDRHEAHVRPSDRLADRLRVISVVLAALAVSHHVLRRHQLHCMAELGELARPDELDESALHERLYKRSVPLSSRPQPDFVQLHAELARPGVTRMLLWQEYKAQRPDGWQYSVFCDRYQRWLATQELVLRQNHAPADKLFVDYAGQTVPITDPRSGEIRVAQIFVAVLGCSNYTYAEATWTQALSDWLSSHVRALEFIGGAPAAIVPDNLKSGVTHAHRYEPEINPSYQDFAEHYGLAILPARVRKPRDKAKVEAGVLVVERWILARLRNRTFFSLGELNAAIGELLEQLNHRPFKKLDGSRQSRFVELDRPALRPLPPRAYEFGE